MRCHSIMCRYPIHFLKYLLFFVIGYIAISLTRLFMTSLARENVLWQQENQMIMSSDLKDSSISTLVNHTSAPIVAQETMPKIGISNYTNTSVCNEFDQSYIWKAGLESKTLQEVLTNDTSVLKFFLFASYFDDRDEIEFNGGLSIRVVGMVHRGTMREINQLYCILWFDEDPTPYSVIGQGQTIWEYLGPYQSAMVTCPLPTPLPKLLRYVTITQTECDLPSNVVPVEYTPFSRRTHGVAVCAKVIYSKPDPVRLIEWLELNFLLGADTIYMYNTSLKGMVNPVLEYYRRTGKVQLMQHSYLTHMAKMIYNSSFPTFHYQLNWEMEVMSMTDCLYTAKERYIVNIDIDEILHPIAYDNYTSPLKAFIKKSGLFDSSDKVAGLVFNTGVFTDEFGVDANSTVPEYLHTMRHSTRTAIDWESPKSVVHADRCKALAHHICVKPRTGYDHRLDLPHNLGYLRHYRHQCRLTGEPDKCKKLMKNPIKDELLLKFKDRLDAQVRPMLIRFGLLNDTKTV